MSTHSSRTWSTRIGTTHLRRSRRVTRGLQIALLKRSEYTLTKTASCLPRSRGHFTPFSTMKILLKALEQVVWAKSANLVLKRGKVSRSFMTSFRKQSIVKTKLSLRKQLRNQILGKRNRWRSWRRCSYLERTLRFASNGLLWGSTTMKCCTTRSHRQAILTAWVGTPLPRTRVKKNALTTSASSKTGSDLDHLL